MKVVKATDLVPVRRSHDVAIFGVTIGVAREGLANGTLALVDVPDSIPTYEVNDGLGDDVRAKLAATELLNGSQAINREVEIPADWGKLHHMHRIKLAKQIFGDLKPPEGVKTLEFADRLLAQEANYRGLPAQVSEEENGGKKPGDDDDKGGNTNDTDAGENGTGGAGAGGTLFGMSTPIVTPPATAPAAGEGTGAKESDAGAAGAEVLKTTDVTAKP